VAQEWDKAATFSGHHGFAQDFSSHSEHSPDSALGFDCVGTTDVDRSATIGSFLAAVSTLTEQPRQLLLETGVLRNNETQLRQGILL
jgi:hypothetical protein